MNYSQEELNQILLSKSLNEFYLAVIENREEILTDEEYEKITRRNDNVYTAAPKENIDSLFEQFEENENLKKFASDLMKMLYSLARIRHMAILTMIDDEVYDVSNIEFVDLKSNQIIHYDNFTNYYDETTARIKFFTPEEEPQLQLKQKTALMDVDDDEANIFAYEKAHINQEESEDLTNSFFAEVKGKSNTLSKI